MLNKHYSAPVSHSRMWKTRRAIHEKKLYHRAPPWRAKLAALPKVLAALSTHSMTKQEFLYSSICRKDNRNWFEGSPPSSSWRQQSGQFCCAHLCLYCLTTYFKVWILWKLWRDFRNPLSDRQAYLWKWGRGLFEELFRDGLSVVYPYYIINPCCTGPRRASHDSRLTTHSSAHDRLTSDNKDDTTKQPVMALKVNMIWLNEWLILSRL